MDSKPWPRGALALAWIPEQDVGGTSNKRSDELRIRASNLDLAAVEGLRSMAAKLSPDLGEIWLATQPSGQIETLALDIPYRPQKNPLPGDMERPGLETVETAARRAAL
jgi:uncharacterized protein YhdP